MKQGTLLTKIVMAVLFLAIVAYVIARIVYTAMNPFQKEMAITATFNNSIAVNAWVFREEVQLPAASGLINLRVDEGERTAANKTVAVVYQSQEALSRQQELREINSRMEQLKYAVTTNSLSGSELESQVTNQLSQLRLSASSGDYAALAENADEYKKLILRRESLYGSNAEETAALLGQALVSLEQEQRTLQETAQGEYSEIISPVAGYYSAHTDGFESLLQPAALDQTTTTGFLNMIQQTPETPDPATLGKVVNSTRWKMAFLVSAEDADAFRTGNQVEVQLSALSDMVDMTVDRVTLPEDGQCVVVLVSDENLKSVLSLRNTSCYVVFSSTTGIQIPKEALRVLQQAQLPSVYSKRDNLTGVFAVTGRRAEFKPVTVLAEGPDYYIVEPNPQYEKDGRILRTGDEVILAATDLYDGKVVQ